MSRDALEAWAARVADGEAVDWDAACRQLDPQELERLKQLEALAGVMRRCTLGEAEGGPSGRRWGHLELRGSLGRGTFGEVKLAFDPVLQREVALKLRRTDGPASDPDAWIDEARQLARVRHPHVLAVHGADIRDGVPGLWADRVEGQTLRQRLVDDLPTPAERLSIAQQLTSAVAAVHAAGLVHGDIKPANVMLESDSGRAILMDFGTAREAGAAPAAIRSTGTPLFMAPERLTGGAASRASDVFALGATFVTLATGRPPFRAESIEALTTQHADGRGPDLGGASMPRAYGQLCRDMLRDDPAARPSIERVAARLERVRTAPARRRRKAALGSIFLLLVAGLLIATTAYVRVRDAESETSAVNVLLRDVLSSPRGTELGREVRVVDVLERAVPEAERRFGDRPLALARVEALVGQTFESLDLHDAAEPLLRRALATYADRLGPDHPRTLDQLDPIARVESATGRKDQAEATWDRLIALADPEIPELRHELIYAHIGKAGHLRAENRVDEALAELDRAAALHVDTHTDRAAQSLYAMRALLLLRAGRLDEAADVGALALDASLRTNGRRHANTLISRDRLVQIRLARGEMEAAEVLAAENLAETREWLGDDERRTVMAQITLSGVLADRGRIEESLALLETAAAGARASIGADHPDTLVIESNRAARLMELGRHADAAAVAERVEASYRSLDEPAGQLPWINGLNLAEALVWLERHEASLQRSARIHAEIVDAHGEGHPLARVAQSYRGAALTGLGRTDEAEPLLAAAHQALAGMMGADHPQVLLIEAWQAEALWRTGKVEPARALIATARTRAAAALPPDHYRLRDLGRTAERVAGDPPGPD